ncbi:MAG: c-type cytochrome [Rubrivivax sp.]|nr:c-type cytochrome [Rubrivivax sp.]
MKIPQAAKFLLLGLTATACTLALAQTRPDLGKREFENNCAVCHASDAKGKGPYNHYLKTDAPDLSQLAKRNGGVFPVARLYDVIEGAGVGHGSRDMPIWGQEYRVKAGEYFGDLPYNEAAFVSGRILALIEHLSKLQAK